MWLDFVIASLGQDTRRTYFCDSPFNLGCSRSAVGAPVSQVAVTNRFSGGEK